MGSGALLPCPGAGGGDVYREEGKLSLWQLEEKSFSAMFTSGGGGGGGDTKL